MKTLNLNICGPKHGTTLDQVRRVITPEGTRSWRPVAHTTLIDTLRSAMVPMSLEVVSEAHALSRNGAHYFGLFQVSGVSRENDEEVGTVVGLRNSHDKAFAAGVCGGSAPFVCTNLVFSNEVVIGRKHTTNILDSLPDLTRGAIRKVIDTCDKEDARIRHYKSIGLSDKDAHHLIINAFKRGASTLQQVGKVVDQWHEPEHQEFRDRNMWSLYNSFSNVWRESQPATTLVRSRRLQETLDSFTG